MNKNINVQNKNVKAPKKEELMTSLVKGLHEQGMLYFLIAALSSEQNIIDQQTKEASISQLKDIKEALKSVGEIPEEEKPKISELIDKSVEICEQYEFE